MSKQKSALQTIDLCIGYRNARRADVVIGQNLNLTVKRGTLVGLLGANGAGKSTLLRTIAGMQKPLFGDVLLSGTSANQIPARELAQKLSVVLTDRPHVGLMNGYALVALGRHPYTDWTGKLSQYDEAMVRWAVDAVNAGDIADKSVIELSDGQRQKLMIARALAQETDLILLDEPTAFLDLPHRVETMKLLQALAHETNRAILLSTHDLDLALRSCDVLWLMADGQVRTGSPEDLVLSDAFEATFRRDGLVFDKQTGTFSIENQNRSAINIIGEGIPYIWTHRALERAGYVIGQSSITVDVQQSSEGTVWYLTMNDHTTTHLSIEHLLTTLDS